MQIHSIISFYIVGVLVLTVAHLYSLRLVWTFTPRYRFSVALLSAGVVAALVRVADPLAIYLDASLRWVVIFSDFGICILLEILCVFLYAEYRFAFRILKRVNGAQHYIDMMRRRLYIVCGTFHSLIMILALISLIVGQHIPRRHTMFIDGSCSLPSLSVGTQSLYFLDAVIKNLIFFFFIMFTVGLSAYVMIQAVRAATIVKSLHSGMTRGYMTLSNLQPHNDEDDHQQQMAAMAATSSERLQDHQMIRSPESPESMNRALKPSTHPSPGDIDDEPAAIAIAEPPGVVASPLPHAANRQISNSSMFAVPSSLGLFSAALSPMIPVSPMPQAASLYADSDSKTSRNHHLPVYASSHLIDSSQQSNQLPMSHAQHPSAILDDTAVVTPNAIGPTTTPSNAKLTTAASEPSVGVSSAPPLTTPSTEPGVHALPPRTFPTPQLKQAIIADTESCVALPSVLMSQQPPPSPRARSRERSTTNGPASQYHDASLIPRVPSTLHSPLPAISHQQNPSPLNTFTVIQLVNIPNSSPHHHHQSIEVISPIVSPDFHQQNRQIFHRHHQSISQHHTQASQDALLRIGFALKYLPVVLLVQLTSAAARITRAVNTLRFGTLLSQPWNDSILFPNTKLSDIHQTRSLRVSIATAFFMLVIMLILQTSMLVWPSKFQSLRYRKPSTNIPHIPIS